MDGLSAAIRLVSQRAVNVTPQTSRHDRYYLLTENMVKWI